MDKLLFWVFITLLVLAIPVLVITGIFIMIALKVFLLMALGLFIGAMLIIGIVSLVQSIL